MNFQYLRCGLISCEAYHYAENLKPNLKQFLKGFKGPLKHVVDISALLGRNSEISIEVHYINTESCSFNSKLFNRLFTSLYPFSPKLKKKPLACE